MCVCVCRPEFENGGLRERPHTEKMGGGGLSERPLTENRGGFGTKNNKETYIFKRQARSEKWNKQMYIFEKGGLSVRSRLKKWSF